METNALTALSDAMVQAAARAGASTLRVDGRGRLGSSGLAYRADLVLAASHAVERERGLAVGLPDGSTIPAQLAGRDPASDLALLRLETPAALPAEIAPAEAQVGQMVLALGRPGDEGLQASLGVVGAVGGPLHAGRGGLIERFIRTDAIPYPGFSGGPLVDGDGRVLGINTSGFVPGASLAIPAGFAWRVADLLARNGRIRRGYLGIRSQVVELPAGAAGALGRSQATGLLLVGVERGQPAAQAGLMVGDILVGLDGQPIQDQDTLMERLAVDAAGKNVVVEILRGGQVARPVVQVGERSGS